MYQNNFYYFVLKFQLVYYQTWSPYWNLPPSIFFSVSLIETSLNRKWSIFSNFCLINKMLGVIFKCINCLLYRISNTRTRIQNIGVFVNIQRFCYILKKKCSVLLILMYHQIGCFLHYLQELFCLQIFSFQKKEVGYFPKKLCYL